MENMADYMANRRKERRLKLIEMAGWDCARCGLVGEEFNHRNRFTKLFNLSGKGLDTSWAKILEEFEKCELLCRSCHLKFTKSQHAAKEIRPWNDKKHEPYLHGTTRTYNELACRCDHCKAAKSLNRKKLLKYGEQCKM